MTQDMLSAKDCESIKFIFTMQLIITDLFHYETELFLFITFIGRVGTFYL